MKILSFLILLTSALAAAPARAQSYPDYASFGGGSYDFDKDQNRRKSLDYRAEYAWGLSLLPFTPEFEPNIQVHPTVGMEGNTQTAFMGEAGLNLDFLFYQHAIFTWGESVGAFDPGNDPRPLGSVMEFRSQLELGWQFDNKLRLTGCISHISNAHILDEDPGAEIAGFYVHVPMSGLN